MTTEEKLTIKQRLEKGRCIARLYIAAQHLSEVASCAALDLLEACDDYWMKHGFDQEMSKSPFPVRALKRGPLDPSPYMIGRTFGKSDAGKALIDNQIKAMTTPPWMVETVKEDEG